MIIPDDKQSSRTASRTGAAPRRIVLRGFPGAPGLAVGSAFVFAVSPPQITTRSIAKDKTQSEIDRFLAVLETTRGELAELKERAGQMVGDNLAKIFDAQMLILSDPEIEAAVREEIASRHVNAETAFDRVVQNTLAKLASSPDAYLRGMMQDIDSVRTRVVQTLMGVPFRSLADLSEPAIVVATSIAPADVVGIHKENLLGIVSEVGGQTSHTTLLAKSLGIPAVVGVSDAVTKIPNGTELVVDGHSGAVIVSPDPETLDLYRRKRRESVYPWPKKLTALKDKPAVTRDGRPIELVANIDMAEEAQEALDAGAAGVGLYRTEYLFLRQGRFPTENEQYRTYRHAAEVLAPRPLTIRTYDLGGDKYFSSPGEATEENPALGWRAIRVSLQKRGPFKSQLRAIMRAAKGTNIRVMFPMVVSVSEVSDALLLMDEACREVCTRGHDVGEVEVGVMIETPASVWVADSLARMVDFFSVGTNDLTQYTMAVDRGNPRVSHLFEHFHPAIIQAIAYAHQCAKRHDTRFAVCGEIASELRALPLLVGLGVDELSVHPTAIPRSKAIIGELSFTEAQEIAQEVLKLESTAEIEALLDNFYRKRFRRRWR